ncbi:MULTISPECIES: hypothetical protein [Aeromonas]|uniref:Uncharacterized protein n=1 Tax=Aeromonas encheleia TaxID=73010 RepID=A0AAE9MF91_9GAMM|nr:MULTISPECIES: hypothetical protein [Aeromonas]MBV7413869.1 hypothetical protein [Aeromonas sp. sif2433]USV56500.1 hypothetical protein NHF51_14210 [Aeromonas encheleia]
MDADLTTLRRRWLKKHLRELRAAKNEEEEQGGMLRFVGILCAALPLLTATVYFVGMRYHHGYLGQFGLESTEFSLPADTTLLLGFYLLIKLCLPYVLPLVLTVGGLFIVLSLLFFKARWRLTLSWWLVRFFVLLPIVLRGVKIAHQYPAPFTFNCLIWLKSAYLKFTIFILLPLLVIWASEHIRPMGKALARSQIEKVETGTWPVTEAHSLSPLLGNEPHIRIACNGSHCAYRLKGGDTLILRFDQIEQTRYRPEQPSQDEASRP